MQQLKARVLCENTVTGLRGLAEHGWAVWLETLSGSYLFDTGQGKTLFYNALQFGIDIGSLDAIFLSHHHYDHTGGLLDALSVLNQGSTGTGVPVYSHPDLFKDSYSIPKGKPPRHIGLPVTRTALEGAGANFCLNTDWTIVEDGIFLTGEIPRLTDFERGDANLKHFDAEGALVRDPVVDDQALVVETSRGLCVFLGCSHAGVINTLRQIVQKTGRSRIHAVVGGMHLRDAAAEQVRNTVGMLQEFGIERIGVGHCTGQRVAWEFARAFGDRFFLCNVGTGIDV